MSTHTLPRRLLPEPAARPIPGAEPTQLAYTSLLFGLFVLANAVLYVRPAEYVGDLIGQRMFLGMMVLCLMLGFPVILNLYHSGVSERPLLVLPLLLWPLIVTSHLGNGRPQEAVDGFFDFARVVPYYLLLVGLVLTPGRLRQMLFWLPWFAGAIVAIAVLQYHDILQIERFSQLQDGEIKRLRATGIFQDPNDLGALLVVCVVCALYFLARGSPMMAPLWLALLGLFGYAIYLTHSRGTLLALGAAFFILLRARIGTFSALALGCVMMAGLFAMSTRTINFDDRYDTALSRIDLWADAWVESRGALIFGVGYLKLPDNIGLVAHNSYLHAFAELGFVGGCVFLGTFVWALWALLGLTAKRRRIIDPELAALHPTMTAVLVGYSVSIFSLSLCYAHPTFTVLGLVAAYLHMAKTQPARPPSRFNDRFVLWLLLLGVLFLGLFRVCIPAMKMLGG